LKGRSHLEVREARDGSRGSAERLAAEFRRLSDVAEGEVECGSGVNIWYLVSFFYKGEGAVNLHVSLAGCGLVENSLYQTAFYPSSGLKRALEAAVQPAG
jgi:hypothetical protein